MTKRKIDLVPHTPLWSQIFKRETMNLEMVLRKNIFEVHHIGSTAIPKILAKPTMDILCVVHTIDGIEAFRSEFERLGFVWKGEYGIPGRLYFVRKASDGVKELSHVNIFEKGNALIDDYLDFRDYLNSEDEVAKSYESLKVKLKEDFSDQPNLYQSGKKEFIETVLKNLR